MRPKVVIMTLVAAFAALGIIAVFKGVAKHGGDSSGPASDSANAGSPNNAATNSSARTGLNSTNPAVSEALRAALIRKAVDDIRELQSEVDGTNNPVIIAALIDKVKSPEAEVRMTALDAIRHINDTNAVPQLEEVEKQITDPREKVVVLDTIDYLKLPDIMANAPPPDTNEVAIPANPAATNRPSVAPPLKMNPKFLHKAGNHSAAGNNSTQPAAPAAPANQPQ